MPINTIDNSQVYTMLNKVDYLGEVIKLKIAQLSQYPRLKNVLSTKYYNEFSVQARNTSPDRPSLVIIYSAFIDLTMNNDKTGYSALDILNSEKKFNLHFKKLIGFIYSTHFDMSLIARHITCVSFKRLFNAMAENYTVCLDELSISRDKITKDLASSIDTFNSITLNVERLEYYKGWTVSDKEGKAHYLHLATVLDYFGKELTQTFHRAIFDFILTKKTNTAKNVIYSLTPLLNVFTDLCKTSDELLLRLQADRSHLFFELVLNTMFANTIVNELDKKTFFKIWAETVKYFSACFIETGVFDEPIKPFLTPSFKEPIKDCYSFSVGGALTANENKRWLTDIPLHIKDDEALDIIHQRLNRDLEHIRTINHQHFVEINQRQTQNEMYIKNNSVKPLSTDENGGRGFPFPLGEEHLGDSVATFYHHGFGALSSYPGFLGFKGKTAALTEALNLPTINTHIILISLLVLEHPLITPS